MARSYRQARSSAGLRALGGAPTAGVARSTAKRGRQRVFAPWGALLQLRTAADADPAGADLAARASRGLDQLVRLEAQFGGPRRGRRQDHQFAILANIRREDAFRLITGQGVAEGAHQAAHVARVPHDVA